jgi:RNA polymerase sporulation-specific sigma factor
VKDRDSLILDNQRLVYWTYQRMKWLPLVARMGEEDATAHGTVGLIKAADGFDPEKGWKFTTYASRAIWREIDNASRSFGVATVPRTTRVKYGESIDRATALRSFPFRMDRENTASALADEPACSIDVFAEVVEREQLARVREAVRSLPRQLRRVIDYVYFRGLSQKEAGRLLGLTGARAGQLVRKALAVLEEELKETV